MSTEDDSFFSRWSRRKAQVRTGQPLPTEPPAPGPLSGVIRVPAADDAPATVVADPAEPPGPPAEPAPVPTLDDVAGLSRESDFRPFVARNVPAEVRNAAVKKLFADPHFNVMDGLDIYIDDYSQPSPLSAAMMAKMVGAQFLKLVDDPDQAKASPPTRVVTPDLPGSTDGEPDVPVEASMTAATPADQPESQDDHADLQLQPDPAAEPEGPGRGAG